MEGVIPTVIPTTSSTDIDTNGKRKKRGGSIKGCKKNKVMTAK